MRDTLETCLVFASAAIATVFMLPVAIFVLFLCHPIGWLCLTALAIALMMR